VIVEPFFTVIRGGLKLIWLMVTLAVSFAATASFIVDGAVATSIPDRG
jgi:hypothetical protein